MRRAFLILLLECALLTGCMYHLLGTATTTTVYVDVFANKSVQPGLETALCANLKRVFAEKPGFVLAGTPASADIVISGTVTDFSRNPGFFAGKDETLVAGDYRMQTDVSIRKGKDTVTRRFDESCRTDLTAAPKTDLLLDTVARKLALDVYFFLVRSYGN